MGDRFTSMDDWIGNEWKMKGARTGPFLMADILEWNLLHPAHPPVADESDQAGSEHEQRAGLGDGGRLAVQRHV